MDNLTNQAKAAASNTINSAQATISSAKEAAADAAAKVAGKVDAVKNALKNLENGVADPKALLNSLKSKLPIPPNLPEIPKKINLKVLKFKVLCILFF